MVLDAPFCSLDAAAAAVATRRNSPERHEGRDSRTRAGSIASTLLDLIVVSW